MKNYITDTIKVKELKNKLDDFLGKLSVGDYIALVKELSGANHEKAEVHFTRTAYYKMWALVDELGKEIAWDGVCTRDPERPNVFTVEDIIVYPQTVTGATVETDDEKYLNWMNGLDDDTFNRRRFNGHSHVNMGVTPSGTDMTYREQCLLNVKDFFVFGIFNKKHDSNFEIYDIENNIVYENKDITFYIPEPDYSGWAKNMIAENVEEKTYTATAATNKSTTGVTSRAGVSYGQGYTGKPSAGGYNQSNLTDYYKALGYYD